IAYEILDHQGLDNYQVADDLRTVLFQVQSRGGKEKELVIVRWVVYAGHLYISPEKAPDPRTGIFTPWILRKNVGNDRTYDELWDQEILQALHLGKSVNHPDVAPKEAVSGQLKPPGATFARVAGPGWLTIKADGSFTGKPEESDSGVNTWLVSVIERDGSPAYFNIHTKEIDTTLLAVTFHRHHRY